MQATATPAAATTIATITPLATSADEPEGRKCGNHNHPSIMFIYVYNIPGFSSTLSWQYGSAGSGVHEPFMLHTNSTPSPCK